MIWGISGNLRAAASLNVLLVFGAPSGGDFDMFDTLFRRVVVSSLVGYYLGELRRLVPHMFWISSDGALGALGCVFVLC